MRRASLVLVTLLLACPLFAWPGSGFDAVRLPAVLMLVVALLGTSFVRSARGAERPPGLAPLRTAGLLLLAAHLLSLFAARTRSEAAAPILILFAGVSAFACLRAGVVRREAAMSLAPVIAGVGLLLAFIGLGQAILKQEAVALEGNRNYAGALSAMFLPATVAFTRTGRTWQRALAGIASIALVGLLLLSESRGGFLAAVVGLLLAGAALGLKRVQGGIPAAGLALLVVVAAALLFQGRKQFSPERLETAGFRMSVYRSGLRMFLARPILGWGAGNFAVEYPTFRSESEFRYSHKYSPEIFRELEDAHSSWVQTAVETGALGLLALLLVAYVAARLWRYYVKVAPDPEGVALLAGLGGGAAAYLVAGLFNTLTLKTSHTLLFWLFLGLIEVIGETRPWRASERSKELRVAIPAAAAITAFFGTLWAGAMGLADAAFIEGMSTRNPGQREARLRDAIERNPYSWKAHQELSLTLFFVDRVQGALEEARAVLRLRPHYVEGLNHAGICLQTSGDLRGAKEMFQEAVTLAPFYANALSNLGVVELGLGERAEARRHFDRSLELHPGHALAYFNRGLLNISGGDESAALEDFRHARSLGVDVGAGLRAKFPAAQNDSRFAEFFR